MLLAGFPCVIHEIATAGRARLAEIIKAPIKHNIGNPKNHRLPAAGEIVLRRKTAKTIARYTM